MIRPSSLYRSDSRRQPTIEASANNIHEDSIDCGISALKCCNTPGCQKLGNKKTFLVILVLCGIIQGAIESYFRISAKQSSLTHEYNPKIIDWLLVASGIFQGLFAVIIAYWGNRIHRTAWLGGMFMLQSVLCLIVIIPTLSHHSEDNDTIEAIEISVLCIRTLTGSLVRESAHGITTLILLFVLQFGIALGTIAFYTLGFSYLDDNVHEHESPGLLAAALAAKFWGVQLGSLVSIFVGLTSFGWWFGWIFLSPILFAIGFIATMFPKRLLSTVVRQAANNILESAISSSNASISNPYNKFIADIDFIPSFIRVFTNKILVLNVLAAVFVQTALVNFSRHEANYLQSRFFLPTSEADGLNNEWTSQLVSSLLKPPMVALSILVAGFIIAKANPGPRKLVLWNIIATSLVVMFFVASIFIDCENSQIAGAHRGRIIKPYCAHSCMCSDNIPFTPVCPEGGMTQTFYSPCHAGCSAEITLNDVRIFGNCSCGVDTEIPTEDLMATVGACGMASCQPFWISFQTLTVLAAALVGSTLIGKLIISLRSVLPQDKSLAIAIELFLAGLIIYIPGKLGYRLIASKTCQYFAPDNFQCFLHESPTFGDWINILTAGLILIGVIFEIALLFCIKDLSLYGDEPDDVYRPIEMRNIGSDDRQNIETYETEPLSPNTAILDLINLQNMSHNRSVTPIVTNNNSPVTYARIDHSKRRPVENDDHLDFNLQTSAPRMQQQQLRSDTDNNSIATSISPASSGYVNLPNIPLNQRLNNRTVRPTSPETSF